MRAHVRHSVLAAVVGIVALGLASTPAGAVEDGLFGVRIGASYREITEKFGPPHGIVFPSMVFQTVAVSAAPGLPSFGAPAATETPVWVLPIRPSTMEATQTEWVYDYRKTRGIALGIILTGEGADAVVSDVAVAGFPENLKGKPAPLTTAKGIKLQSTFEDVLKKYGYPPLIEIYPAAGGAGAAQGGAAGAMRAGVGARGGGMRAGGGGRGGGGMRGGGMRAGGGGRRGGGMGGGGRGMRGGRGGGRGRDMGAAPGPGVPTVGGQFGVVLTGAPGGRGMRGGRRGGGGGGMGGGMRGGGMRGGGGGRGGGMRGGGMRGGGMGGRRGGGGAGGALPPLGAAAPTGASDQFSASAVVNHQAISFSRDCTLVYEGIAFALHDMKVFRIHVSE